MRSPPALWRAIYLVLICFALASPLASQAQPPFSPPQLSQLVAPIALYPDALLTQILMASTYPADVAEAARWSQQHPNLQGDLAVAAVQNRPWDPSVQSLVAFPQVLAMMGSHPAWVQDLGDAFLAEPEQLMEAVQRLRLQAQRAGHLASSKQLRVRSSAPNLIVIEPVSPTLVYVPYYDPLVVYGTWAYPAYPPLRIPPPILVVDQGVVFGSAIVVSHALWGGYNWAQRSVYINVPNYNRIIQHNKIKVKVERAPWQHNPLHRRDVPYRTPQLSERFKHPLLNKAVTPQIIEGKAKPVPPQAKRKHEREQKPAQDKAMLAPVPKPAKPHQERKPAAPQVAKHPPSPIVRGEIKPKPRKQHQKRKQEMEQHAPKQEEAKQQPELKPRPNLL